MGFFSSISRVASRALAPIRTVTRAATRIPGVKYIPGIGAGLMAADLAMTGIDALTSMGSTPTPQMPALPSPFMPMQRQSVSNPFARLSSMPMLQGYNAPQRQRPPLTASGSLPTPASFPGQSPLTAGLPPIIGAGFLKTYLRAPKGYVIVRDEVNNVTVGMLKTVAKARGLWKPAKKPPITVRDWNDLKGANRTVNKLKRIGKMAENVANFKSTRTITRRPKAC